MEAMIAPISLEGKVLGLRLNIGIMRAKNLILGQKFSEALFLLKKLFFASLESNLQPLRILILLGFSQVFQVRGKEKIIFFLWFFFFLGQLSSKKLSFFPFFMARKQVLRPWLFSIP